MVNSKTSLISVFKNKKILITGHTGFKGSWLTLWLKELGADIIGYSLNPPTEPSLFKVLGIDQEITHVVADIRDHEKIKDVIKEHKPEFVFHLAAQPIVLLSYREPRETYETNIMGTINLFEAVRASESVRVVVNVTSDKCYENKEQIYGYREDDAMGGYDPYSSSKGCSELVTASYRNSFFHPEKLGKTHNVMLASARAGNVIGGGDWADSRLIPDFVRSIANNEKIIIRSPQSIRPWQHVLEPLSGYLCLAAKMYTQGTKYCGGWNFGPNDADILTVEEVVSQLIRLWGKGSYAVNHAEILHEAKILKLDTSKAKAYLQWSPAYSAVEAIEKTVDWYRAYYEGSSMRELTVTQINDYSDKAKVLTLDWA